MCDIDRLVDKLGGPLPPKQDAAAANAATQERQAKMEEHPDAVLQLKRKLEREPDVKAAACVTAIKSGPAFFELAQKRADAAREICLVAGDFAVNKKHTRFMECFKKLKQIAGGQPDGRSYKQGMPTDKKGKTISWTVYSGHFQETVRKFAPAATLDKNVNEAEKVSARPCARLLVRSSTPPLVQQTWPSQLELQL